MGSREVLRSPSTPTSDDAFCSGGRNDALRRLAGPCGPRETEEALEGDRHCRDLAVRLMTDGYIVLRSPIELGGDLRASDDQEDAAKPRQSGQALLERKTVHREVDHGAGEGAHEALPIRDGDHGEIAAPPVGDGRNPFGELVIARVKIHPAGPERSGRERDVRGEARVSAGSVTDPEDRDLGKGSTCRGALRRTARFGGHGTPTFPIASRGP
jgi:hypothetical protein